MPPTDKASADAGLLVVSFHFPPAGEPRAIQVGNLMAGLERPLLVAHGSHPRRHYDASLQAPPLRHPQSRLLDIPLKPHPITVRLEFYAGEYSLPLAGRSPDMFRWWRRPAVRAILAAVKDLPWRPKAILTFAQPWTVHLVGLDLHRALGLPWLAHFSDLWSDWPFVPPDFLTKRLNRRMEAAVVREAQRVLFTSPETLDLFMAKYPPELRSKAGLLTHCYVPGDYPPQAFQPGPRRVIRYLGNFYGRRDPSLLVKPLQILLATRPQLLKDLTIEIVGTYKVPGGDNNPFAALPPGLLVFRGAVPHKECLALMAQAEALLVIEFPVPRSVWLPSKIIEYIGAGRPVLGMVPDGASRRVIEDLGGLTADPADAQAVADMLASYLANPAPPSPWGREQARSFYAVDQMRAQLEALLEETLAGVTSG